MNTYKSISVPLKNNISVFAALIVAFVLSLLIATTTFAATDCNFTEDLNIGSEGEDVRCLQKFLNSNGFTISTSGAGAPGHETDTFKEKTEDALILWQISQGISPATGNFGPASRAKYKAAITAVTPPVTTTTTTVVTPAVVTTPVVVTPPAPVISSLESQALAALNDARSVLVKAAKDIKDSKDDDKNTDKAEDFMIDANEEMLLAFYDFLDKKYQSAIEHAKDAKEFGDDTRSSVKNSRKKDGLTLAKAIIFNNETVVKVVFDGDEFVFTTSKKQKTDITEQIVDEVDDSSLEEDEVLDLLDVDTENRDSTENDKEIDEEDEEDSAKDAIDDAKEAIEEAHDEISDADDDGEDVDKAEDLEDEANDALDDAEEAFDDEDWSEAIDLAEEAKDLADDAVDAIGE